ncbi:beta-ketoacyl-ACP synthase II [Simkania negevensis]|uniref:3-oxoacyl-[acyl-carrier-protein] synthase 2 n=1 Tax=Simkania negevensis TaxID=83561 RepID=A0ABS3AQ97_9BACT|nr:beta-ketoacyl-ACP synthase II [Simkania negevensis]
MTKKRIVITGMGIVSCFGNDVDVYYDRLLAGTSGVKKIEKFPCVDYPTQIAAEVVDFDPGEYVEKKLARRGDSFIKYAVVAGKKALEAAGLAKEGMDALDKTRCGIIIGSGMGGMSFFFSGVEAYLTKGYKRVSPFFIPYVITNMAGAMLAIDLGFSGPNYSISTACATANYCFAAAADHIWKGDADLFICGGAEAAVIPMGLAGFISCKAVSQRNDEPERASRPWDKGRDGFVMGEGSGVLVLESLEHAQKRGAPIIAEYLGHSVSCDAYHMTDPLEDGSGVERCINNALQNAGVAKENVNYLNAHATSTPVGDVAELMGIKRVFGSHSKKIKMNGTKSMIGHCLGAAAGMEAIALLQAIRCGKLHPTLNVEDPEPILDEFDPVLNKAQDHEISVGLNNSFGFGGHNSCIVIAPYNDVVS